MPLPDSKQLRLKRYYPDAVYKTVTGQVSVPRPMTKTVGGEPLRDLALLAWCEELLTTVLDLPHALTGQISEDPRKSDR
jgi:transcription-repair coupling factor (superfamily II helicase)